jgi:ATP-dependent Lon protease
LIPAENEKDLAEIPENIKNHLEIRCVSWIDEVLELALQYSPTPMAAIVETNVKDSSAKEIKPNLLAH